MSSQRPTFSEWVTATGNALGYTNSASLARALDIQQSTVSRWKTKNSQPSVEHLDRISRLFGVDLKVLLVLAGYLEAQPPSSEELVPAAARTRADSMIREAKLSAAQKHLISDFWLERMEEEHARLGRMIAFAEEAVQNGASPQGIEFAVQESKSDLAPKLALWHMTFLGTIPLESRFDYSVGVEEPETGWLRPPELIGVEFPRGYAIQLSQPGGDGARVIIMAPGGAPIAWTRAFPTQMEALREAPGLLAKTPKAPLSEFGDTDAPEA